MNDVFVQGLQALQSSAGILQLDADLAQLGGKQASQISNREECEQVDEDDCLERFEPRMGRAIRADHSVVIQLQNAAVEDECERGDQASPHSWQEHAGNNDDQRIKKIERTVPAPGLVEYDTDEDNVGEHLECALETILLPKREQQHIKERQAVPEQDRGKKQAPRHGRGTELCHRHLDGKQQC